MQNLEKLSDSFPMERSPLKPIGTVISKQIGQDQFQMKESLDEDLEILKDYQYSLSYIPSKGPRRRKRVVH